MLNDFNQNKNDQTLDPLTEEPRLPMGKKIGFLFLGLTLIGLFVFFTSDFWTSDSSSSSSIDELKEEIAKLRYRVNELEEQQIQARQQPSSTPEFFIQKQQEIASLPQQTSIDNLQALIEQELRETTTVEKTSPKEEKVVVAKASPEKEKQTKTYTVKKGDTLSKISQQFYGTTKKWRRIVDANKEHLGHNQVLRAGMVLNIPQEA